MLPSSPRPGPRPARDAERGVAPRAFPVNSPVAGAARTRYLSGSSASSASSSTAHLSPASASGGYARAAYARPPSVASVDSMYSTSSLGNSAYPKREHVHANSPTTAKYAYSPGLLSSWGQMADYKEEDDLLHRPDPKRDYQIDRGGTFLTRRGVANLGCLLVLVAGILGLFVLFPALTFFSRVPLSALGLGSPAAAAQASSQVRGTAFGRAKVDIATPLDVHSRTSYHDPTQQLQLVWSDEFEVEGRSFYPGDDPFWEAVDLNYWQTGDLEWYDPAAITTANGSLEITLSIQQRENNHDLIYRSGMLSTWNKMCFSGGLVETKVSLPGFNDIVGLWPAVWTMGNLGRAGYGGSLEGMWPYSYDSCDVGTMPNQTFNGQPAAALEVGDPANGNVLSFLQGQKLSRCTCDGEKHPGPKHDDGTYVGRSAPEIDIIEATMGGAPLHGQVSQSLQAAPFNFNYTINGDNGAVVIANESVSEINSYRGGAFQQAVSALSDTDQTAYELDGGGFSVYGYEYKGGFDDAYITWISNNQVSWTLLSEAIGADEEVGISARSIPQEPMYVIANLGLSPNFGTPDFTHLKFPAKMRIDYVRVYQHPDQINIGCSPKDFPTEDYINEFIGAYTNENLTTWRDDFGQPFPKNSFAGECSV